MACPDLFSYLRAAESRVLPKVFRTHLEGCESCRQRIQDAFGSQREAHPDQEPAPALIRLFFASLLAETSHERRARFAGDSNGRMAWN